MKFNNKKGQALIESVLILPISILFFIYTVQVLIYFSIEISIDDALENYLLCQIQSRSDCQKNLNEHFIQLKLKNIKINYSKRGNLYRIELESNVLNIFNIKKTRELNYAKKI